jgi:hypothetical protein
MTQFIRTMWTIIIVDSNQRTEFTTQLNQQVKLQGYQSQLDEIFVWLDA